MAPTEPRPSWPTISTGGSWAGWGWPQQRWAGNFTSQCPSEVTWHWRFCSHFWSHMCSRGGRCVWWKSHGRPHKGSGALWGKTLPSPVFHHHSLLRILLFKCCGCIKTMHLCVCCCLCVSVRVCVCVSIMAGFQRNKRVRRQSQTKGTNVPSVIMGSLPPLHLTHG